MVDPTEFDRKTAHLRFVRGWDLASSTKETAKDDPDFTSGCKMAVVQLATSIKGVTIPVLFIADFVRGQWEAPERNKIIVQTSIHDGDRVGIGVEAFGGYKDSFTTLKQILLGYRSVLKVNLPGDKRAKAQVLIPCFESGNVYMKKGSWNDAVIRQIRDFDGGQHDDDIDAMCVAFAMHKRQTRMGNIPGV
jgi:predicted phage terminase large subunit-like protein